MTSREVDHVLSVAREMPELSCRQLAAWTTDNMGFSVSESTVYRVLRREGLVKRPEMRLAAGKEYHRKTTGPHQMWATNASYFMCWQPAKVAHFETREIMGWMEVWRGP